VQKLENYVCKFSKLMNEKGKHFLAQKTRKNFISGKYFRPEKLWQCAFGNGTLPERAF